MDKVHTGNSSMVQGVDKVYLMSFSRGATMQGRFRKDVAR